MNHCGATVVVVVVAGATVVVVVVVGALLAIVTVVLSGLKSIMSVSYAMPKH